MKFTDVNTVRRRQTAADNLLSQKHKHQLRKQILNDLHKHGEEIYRSENFQNSNNNLQHGEVSVKRHCEKVAFSALWLARRIRLRVNERELIRGALLHDYFLYDWHDEEHSGFRNLHGFKHPFVALKNASDEYELTEREADIIKKHMWPMTFFPPRFREGWIVTLADKYVSTKESVHFIKMKRKYLEINRQRKEQQKISQTQ